MTTNRLDYDALYHRLFSDPRIVAQLLREFVPARLLDGLDLEAMDRLNTTFHADTGQRREGDLVWRIPRRDGDEVYVALLLEFQSRPDHWMALRVLVYAGLLWQQLVTEQRLLPDGRLPPILPIVLYNGDPRWRAPVALRDLVGLPETSPLWPWQPDMRYHLIDEGAFSDAELQGCEGLPALLFRMEGSPDPGQVAVLADAVLAWFARHPGFQAARSVFAEFLGDMMAPLAPGVRVPEELLEVRNMLASRAEQWKQEWLTEGRLEGERQGQAAMVLRLLERRFGALPEQARGRVLAADTVTPGGWGPHVLDADSLDDVLA